MVTLCYGALEVVGLLLLLLLLLLFMYKRPLLCGFNVPVKRLIHILQLLQVNRLNINQ